MRIMLDRVMGYGPESVRFHIFVDDTKYYDVQCSVVGQVFLYRLGIQIFGIDTYLGLLNCHSLGKIDTSNPMNT